MSKTYDPHIHTFVTVNHPKNPKGDGTGWDNEGWRGCFEIVLHTGKHVWVPASCWHEGHPDVKRVGDSRDNGYDDNGCCILSVPAEWCQYYTNEEAHSIEMCIDADERLLSYAR